MLGEREGLEGRDWEGGVGRKGGVGMEGLGEREGLGGREGGVEREVDCMLGHYETLFPPTENELFHCGYKTLIHAS